MPLTAWQIGALPAGAPLPLVLASLAALQPFVLLAAGAFAGAFAAPKIGLRSTLAERLAGRAGEPRAFRGLASLLLISVLLGVAITLADSLAEPLWLPAGSDWPDYAEAWTPIALGFGLLYGGLTEEVMFRWGAMSLVAWLVWRLRGARPTARNGAIVAGIAVSALLFGAAHLPALAGVLPLSAGPVARTILLNGLAGLWLGWVFHRRHLEAAMACHAAIHIGFATYAVTVLVLR